MYEGLQETLRKKEREGGSTMSVKMGEREEKGREKHEEERERWVVTLNPITDCMSWLFLRTSDSSRKGLGGAADAIFGGGG